MRSRRFWIGLAVSVLFLFLFLYRVNLGEMAEALKGANYTFVLPALALYGASMLFRSLRWRFLLRPLKSLGVGRLFPVVVIGYMANNLLPVRLGELVRAYYLSERERVSASATLATIVLERVYDGLTLLFFIAVASLFLPLSGLLKGVEDALGLPGALVVAGLTMPFIGAIIVLITLARSPQAVEPIVRWVSRLLPLRLRPRVAELIERFLQGLSVLRSPRLLLELFLLSLPIWILEASVAYLLAFAFDLPGALGSLAFMVPVILVVTGTANLAMTLPSSQGGVGPFEFFAKTTLVVLGVGGGVASAYALALHVVLIVPITVLGLAYLWWANLSLAQLARRGEAAPLAPSAAGLGAGVVTREEEP